MTSYNNCRFCKKAETDGSNSLLKYGVRHYAHYKCYIDAGKSLDDLHFWQLGCFPFRLIKDYGLEVYYDARAEKEKRDEFSRQMRRMIKSAESDGMFVAADLWRK